MLVPKEKVWQKAKDEYKKSYYSQLEQSLVSLREQMIKYNEKFLAMPRISSGLDEGNWDEIQEIIKKVFKNTDIEIQIRYIADSIQIGNIRYTLEYAKSDRSRCRTCKQYIKKDNLRIVESIPMGRYISKSNYCKKCGMPYIKGIKNSAEKLLKLILKDDFDI